MARALKKSEEQAVSAALLASLETEAGAGFEDVSSDDFGIPFIYILQKNSPQCDEDDDGYIDGAKAGMFWDSGAMAVLKDSKGEPLTRLMVTPVYYERRFNQWGDRDAGGGFEGSHPADADIVATAVRDERGRLQLEGGSYLADTRQFYCLVYATNMKSARPVIIGMASTQIKAARQWMTRMVDFKVAGAKGMFNPPMFGQIWELTTVVQSNASGSWRGWRLGEPQLVTDTGVFAAAKQFRDSVRSGAAKAAQPGGTVVTVRDEEEDETAPPF